MENNPATQKTELRRRPTAAQLRLELERESKKRKFPRFLKVLLFLLVVVLIAAITFFCLLSGYVVYGDSMMPTLQEGDLVLAIPNAQTQPGDLVAFRHDERILIKRAVGAPGDQIEVSDNGTVRINGVDLSEPMPSLRRVQPMTSPILSRFRMAAGLFWVTTGAARWIPEAGSSAPLTTGRCLARFSSASGL